MSVDEAKDKADDCKNAEGQAFRVNFTFISQNWAAGLHFERFLIRDIVESYDLESAQKWVCF